MSTTVSLTSLWIVPPSSCHSMWSTPDTGSTAETVTCRVVGVQLTVPGSVTSLGALRSTLTVSARHGEALPAASTARVMRV